MPASIALPALRPDRLTSGSATARLRALVARRRARAELRRLLGTAAYLLADIGLEPDEVVAELAKPLWRV